MDSFDFSIFMNFDADLERIKVMTVEKIAKKSSSFSTPITQTTSITNQTNKQTERLFYIDGIKKHLRRSERPERKQETGIQIDKERIHTILIETVSGVKRRFVGQRRKKPKKKRF